MGFDGKRILVHLQPRSGEGAFRFASWTLRNYKSNFKRIKQYNKNRPLKKGHYVSFPFNALNDSIQSIVLQALFSNDTNEAEGWAHRVMFPGETISLIAGVFAKNSIPPSKLIEYNRLKSSGKRLKVGDTIIVPWDWIKKELNLRPISVRNPLKVKKDKFGKRYAYYRIRKGESLYSAVVVRFTGRTLADDVNRMARELLKLNGIADEHRVLVNTDVKIPLEWIGEEYLIQKTPQLRPTVPKEKPRKKKSLKKGQSIHIILDPGHGGRDPGATFGSARKGNQVFEDETVYDISLRMARILQSKNFFVHTTLQDPNQKHPVVKLAVKKDEDEKVLVHPPYIVRNVRVGINMRIFLVNHIYENLIKQKIPSENILLVSLHGDALHKSLRGITVYFPDQRLRVARFKLNDKVYRRRKEYRRRIVFKYSDSRRAARSSFAFGKTVVQTFKNAGLKTHKSFAVRGYYYRKGKRTLPAILRYSKIPTSVLVEVGNLNNAQDRNAFLKAAFREKIAATLAHSIVRHFHSG